MVLINQFIGRLSNFHLQGSLADIFIFSTPRSGSTFLMELLQSQDGVKVFNEPLNLNYKVTCRELDIYDWETLTTLADREAVFGKFFHRLRDNKIPEMNRPFYRKQARFITRRNVFKVLHGGEDMIPWFEQEFGAKIIVLVRHPIPTALSHKYYPRLPYYLHQPAIRKVLTQKQIALTQDILEQGTHLERGVVNWCLQNVHALALDFDPNWAIISYEDLTVFPHPAAEFLREKVELSPFRDLDSLVSQPSRSTSQSDTETKSFFENLDNSTDRRFLIEKWRKVIEPEHEDRAFEILNGFGIDYYEHGNLFPKDKYRIVKPGQQEKTKSCST